MPGVCHGYLGFPKGGGCTRFLPILTKEDMAVYYAVIEQLQNDLVINVDGVYGGWWSVPEKVKKNFEEQGGPEPYDIYSQEALNKSDWFKNWSSFNELLQSTVTKTDYGNYVITTDIANFYDTIDTGKLIQKVQSVVSGKDELILLLKAFLSYWDRRVQGYHSSTKGVPQEIFSDASRLLANFYLNDFDLEFKSHCEYENMMFTRWSDDIIVFGQSQQKLESAVHKGSRALLKLGLNFNASKSKIFTRKEFAKYRALDLLKCVSDGDVKKFEKYLRSFDLYRKNNVARVDTVYRATLGFLYNNPKARNSYTMNFVEEESKKYSQLCVLNAKNMRNRIFISSDPKEKLEQDLGLILKYPYAASRAQALKFLSQYKGALQKNGVTHKQLVGYVTRISNTNGGSSIVKDICVPRALEIINA